MDRVVTLCNKLQEQIAQNASADQLLVTVEMLQSELQHLKLMQPKTEGHSAVAVRIAPVQPTIAEPVDEGHAEKTIQVLQVDEAELEAELEEIKRNAQEMNNMGAQNKPALLFDPVEDIPTLIHQQPLEPLSDTHEPLKVKIKEVHQSIARDHSSASLNEKLKQTQIELGDSLLEAPIKDLKKAIGINDRFLFIAELFRGDEVMYERSIKTINSFAIFPEAEYWIKRELKLKLGWNDKNEVVKQFDQLVKRRFF